MHFRRHPSLLLLPASLGCPMRWRRGTPKACARAAGRLRNGAATRWRRPAPSAVGPCAPIGVCGSVGNGHGRSRRSGLTAGIARRARAASAAAAPPRPWRAAPSLLLFDAGPWLAHSGSASLATRSGTTWAPQARQRRLPPAAVTGFLPVEATGEKESYPSPLCTKIPVFTGTSKAARNSGPGQFLQ